MGRPVMPAADAIDSLRSLTLGEEAAILGGATACARECEVAPSFDPYAYGDVDIFHPSMESLMSVLARLMAAGAVPLSRKDDRILRRWKKRGTNGWKTNSVRLETLQGVEVNLVYKTIDKHPLRTPLEQTASFDFTHLGVSYRLKDWQRHDLGDYFYPGGQNCKYRMFPDREEQWLDASISVFTGSRQGGRYARHVERGYDLLGAKYPLMEGYRITAEHYAQQDNDELQLTSDLYLCIADLIEVDDIDGLLRAYEEYNPHSKVQSLAAAMKKVAP